MSDQNAPPGEQIAAAHPAPIMKVMTWRRPTLDLGVLPKYNWAFSVRMYVQEAFDAGTTLKVGHAADDDAYATATTVDSTGTKSPTLGAGAVYDATARTAIGTLSGTPTVGKALVIIEFLRTPRIN